ncbi:hypothetical protein HZC30_03485 [Candidatus Woesearchaeota archaeon]|nr:hypothetical protein [Candidatus Woesearchaeota archaeon]
MMNWKFFRGRRQLIVALILVIVVCIVIFGVYIKLPFEKQIPASKGWMKVIPVTYGSFYIPSTPGQQTSDGGYIIVRSKMSGRPSSIEPESGFPTNDEFYLFKTDANGNKLWEKTFGGESGDIARSVQQTSDGGYIITGSYQSYRIKNGTIPEDTKVENVRLQKILAKWPERIKTKYNPRGEIFYLIGSEAYLVKTDANGNMIWEKTFGDFYNENAYSIQQTSDGGYIVVGDTGSFGVSPYTAKELGQSAPEDVYLVKTDANGNEQWNKVFGGKYVDVGYSVQQSSDGGYIIAGFTVQNNRTEPYIYNGYWGGQGVADAYLIKTDSDGNKLWEKTFGENYTDEVAFSVQQTSDGGYILTGLTGVMEDTHSGQPRDSDVYLLKTDENGNKVWERKFGRGEFGRSKIDEAFSVKQTSDGGYIIAGKSSTDAYLIKTDAIGNKLWEKTFGGGSGQTVQQASDGGYIIIGVVNYEIGGEGQLLESRGSFHTLLIKTDENGNM